MLMRDNASIPPLLPSAASPSVARSVRGWLLLLFAFLSAEISAPAAEDLRDRFGTRSMEAANLIEEGLQKMEAARIQEAMKLFEKAGKVDPACEFATYWIATAAADLGDIDRSIQLFESIVESGAGGTVSSITVDSAINLGITHGQVGDDVKATQWFSRAILLDPKDRFKLGYKAYRNMAIGFSRRNQPLSAAICALNAFDANPEMVEEEMVVQMLNAVGNEEVGTPLDFPMSGESPKPRAAIVKAQTLDIPGVDEEIVDIQMDPLQDRVFAFAKDSSNYYHFDGAQPDKAVKIAAKGTILAASANAGELYLMLESPAALVQVDPATGDMKQQWPLKMPSHSVAVYPIQKLAFFPMGGAIQVLNLATSELRSTESLATRVRVDPRQRFCFSDIHPGHSETGGHMIVNGQPIFFQSTDVDWAQTSLVRNVLAQDDLVMSSFRLNAASNGSVLHVSPDGKWVAEIGGGGWRPANSGQYGYGVALFSADDLGHLQGFFPTEAYPHGAAVNHVAGLVAVFNEETLSLYDLASNSNPVELAGKFGSASAWDSRGTTLYIASEKTGISAFQIEQSESEIALAKNWVDSLKSTWPAPLASARETVTEVTPVTGLDRFDCTATKEQVIALIETAEKQGRTTKPVTYTMYPPYTSGAASRKVLEDTFNLILDKNAGVAIFQLKKLLEAEPENPALLMTLGLGYFQTGQLDESFASHLKALHLDAGRTSVSIEALRNLAHIQYQRKEAMAGAKCYAAVLLLDKVNPKHVKEATEFFENAELLKEAKNLLESGNRSFATNSEPSAAQGVKLPAPDSGAEMEPVALFSATVQSVVLIEVGSGSGSGVCVSEGVVLTNHHVVSESGTGIQVHPFILADGKLERLASKPATVLFKDPSRDLALLAIENPPSTLKPLPLAKQIPLPGTPVYALGSPGLGQDLLEQSITEGIISSAERVLDGLPYVQHSAAVNPGNSGGPLLNRQGHVVGINTAKVQLENVSFAIPAPAVRALIENR